MTDNIDEETEVPTDANIYDSPGDVASGEAGAEGTEQPEASENTGGIEEPETTEGAEGATEGAPEEPEVPKGESAVSPGPDDDTRIAAIAAKTVEAINRQQSQRAGKSEPDVDPAELRKLLNPVEVTPEMLESLGFVGATPEQIKGFQQFSNAIVKNATSIASIMAEQRLRDVLAPYEQHINYVERQQQVESVNAFYSANPDLQRYQKFVEISAKQTSPTRPDGSEKSYNEVANEIATNVREMLKATGVTAAKQPAKATHSAGVSKVPKMASLQTPGRSTSGQPNSDKSNRDANIYS